MKTFRAKKKHDIDEKKKKLAISFLARQGKIVESVLDISGQVRVVSIVTREKKLAISFLARQGKIVESVLDISGQVRVVSIVISNAVGK